jgi:hypothetical protein
MSCETPNRPRCDGSAGKIIFSGAKYSNLPPGDDGTVPAYKNTTVVNGCAPDSLDSPSSDSNCGYSPPAHPAYDGTNNCIPALGPWTNFLPLPDNTYTLGYQLTAVALISPGAGGYAATNVLTLAGGTADTTAQITIDTVDGSGNPLTWHISRAGGYTANPASPNSPTGGAGSGASFSLVMSPTRVQLANCRSLGFKNGQSAAAWFGTLPIQYTAPTSRFRTISGSLDYYHLEVDPDFGPGTQTFSLDVTLTIDDTTGRRHITQYNYSSSYTGTFAGTTLTGKVINENTMRTFLMALMRIKNPDPTMGLQPVLNNSGSPDFTGVPLFDLLTSLNYTGVGGADGTASVSISPSSYSGSSDVTQVVGLGGETTITFDIELSDEKTVESHATDLKNLLTYVPFYDDKAYPFRTDSNVSVAPLISLNQQRAQTDETFDPAQAGLSAYDGSSSPAAIIHGGTNTDDPEFGTEYVLVSVAFPYTLTPVSVTIPSTVQQQSSWSIVQGTLPSGLSISGNVISGTVTDTNGSLGYVLVLVTGLARYDGSVLGQFNPPGYGYRSDGVFQGHFDFRHVVGQHCVYFPSGGGEADEYYVRFYGQFTPDYLPANCTQWSDPVFTSVMWVVDGVAYGLPKGAWIYTNSSGNYSIMQKWMEVNCGTWPSYSFDRPCGPVDRQLVDGALLTCDPDTGAPLCSGNPDLTACLRYPNAPVSAIALTIANGGSGYVAGDVLTFAGGTGTPAQATVDTVDGTGKILTAHISVYGNYTGSLPANPNSPTGGAGTGASLGWTAGCDPSNPWHDNNPKHTFVYATWNKDAHTCSTQCLTFSNRCAMLMVISPNAADKPKNGFFTSDYDLTKIRSDSGGWSQSDVIQNCTSLLWQQSHCTDPTALPDTVYTIHPPQIEGGGGFDGFGNALPPQIEAFCDLPLGAPTPPVALPDFSGPSGSSPRTSIAWPWQLCS